MHNQFQQPQQKLNKQLNRAELEVQIRKNIAEVNQQAKPIYGAQLYQKIQQKTKIIIDLEFPEEIDCPSQICKIKLEKFNNHFMNCKEIKKIGVKKWYVCQFHYTHLFQTYQERDRHEHNCIIFRLNDSLHNKNNKLTMSRGDIDYRFVSDIDEYLSKQKQTQSYLNKWDKQRKFKEMQKDEEEKKLQQIKDKFDNKLGEFTKIHLNNAEYKFTVTLLQNPLLDLLRIDQVIQDVYFENNRDQYQLQRFQNSIIDIETIAQVDNQQFIIEIFKKINTQEQFDSICFAQFQEFNQHVETYQIQSRVKYLKHEPLESPFRIGINSKKYDTDQDSGQILMLVHKKTIKIGKFLKSDWAILVIDQKMLNKEFYFVTKNYIDISKSVSNGLFYQKKLEIQKKSKSAAQKIQKYQEDYLLQNQEDQSKLRVCDKKIEEIQKEYENIVKDHKQEIYNNEQELKKLEESNEQLPEKIKILENQIAALEKDIKIQKDKQLLDYNNKLEAVNKEYLNKLSLYLKQHYENPQNTKTYQEYQKMEKTLESLLISNKNEKNLLKQKEKDILKETNKIQKITKKYKQEKQEYEQNLAAIQNTPEDQQNKQKLQSVCKLCLNKQAKTVIQPCNHLLYCLDCYYGLLNGGNDMRFCHLCGHIAVNKIFINE